MSSLVERLTTQTTAPEELRGLLGSIRRRWRLRHVLAGALFLVALALVLMLAGAFVLRQFRFSPESVIATRWSVIGILIAAAAWWIARPLVRRANDERVALYTEEREPALEGALLGAVDVVSSSGGAPPPLGGHLIAHTVRQLRTLEVPQRIERVPVTRYAAALAGALVLAAVVIRLTPSDMRHALALLAAPWKDASAAAPYAVLVEPGNAEVPKGSDVQLKAQLRGFNSAHVVVAIRRGAATTWEEFPMTVANDSGSFELRLFDLAASADYYVEASGVRSGVYRLRVRELPAVDRIDLEYRYPAYTGLGVERVQDGGDIAAIIGTRVTVQIKTTLPVRGGRLTLEGDTTIALSAVNDTLLHATLTVRRDGFYRVALEAQDGTRVAGTIDYAIDALDDAKPSVTIRKPGRDTRPTSIEELYIEATADDDYGVAGLELVYRVNGGEEKTVPLSHPSAAQREVSASHTLYLEEMSLKPGDVVSYYARATDNNAITGAQTAASDIYFATVRRFDKNYRQGQPGGGGGGGEQEGNPSAFAARQRDIIAGTYKVERDRASMDARALRENVATLVLSQAKLREQVQRLIDRAKQRGVAAADSNMAALMELLPEAVKAMQGAEGELNARRTREALGPEHTALQQLERAEALFKDVDINFGGQGGGGGENEARPDELADLFELEADRLRNQYETVQQSRTQAQRDVDETLERLKQLASRQQAENERAMQRGAAPPNASGGGGSQRQLADEAEQLARQLERLTREQQSAELEESVRRLREAANAMRRSATNSSGSQAAGAKAADELERARRLLEQSRSGDVTRGAQDAVERARRLAEEQRGIAQDAASTSRDAEKEQRLDQRKGEMANEVKQLERDLDQLSRDGRTARPDAARKLAQAADELRQGRVADKIQYSRALARAGQQQARKGLEDQIKEDLEAVAQRLGEAANSASSDPNERTTRALERARSLARGLASMEDRLRQRENQQGQSGTRGGQDQQRSETGGQSGQQQRQQSQAGQQGGRQGQEGQSGSGQQGQQGQEGGSGGQQGQQGQAGGQGQGQGQGGQQQGQGGAAARNQGGQQQSNGQGGGFVPFSPNEVRQWQRELRERRADAEALRRDLAGTELDAGGNIADLIRRLRELEAARVYNDPEELARLQQSVTKGFQELEFALSRALGQAAGEGPTLGGTSDVPPAYRELVDKYFKALAQKGTRKN